MHSQFLPLNLPIQRYFIVNFLLLIKIDITGSSQYSVKKLVISFCSKYKHILF